VAFFDLRDQRICVRVVYDGVSNAGKTTNLEQLSALFASQRATELYAPGEVNGRTLYFDWLQIVAGVMCGFPLTCQVLSVPGQVVLTPRRRHLLATADLVVYVCDSGASETAAAARALRTLVEVRAERGGDLPVVVQANKQDQPDAIGGRELTLALGLSDSPVVEAIAKDGVGVVDTFVTAVRTISRTIQARASRGRVRIPVERATGHRALLDRVAAVRVDPEWAAEALLEQVLAEMWMSERGARGGPGADDGSATVAAPRLPDAEVPTGFVWPAHTGRAILRRLSSASRSATARLRDGRAQIEIETHRLTTGLASRFEDGELARQALVRAARERTQLGELLATETVLVLSEAADGAHWLWTLTPALPSAPAAIASRAPAIRAELTRAFARAAAELAAIGARRGLDVDLDPQSFGIQGNAIRYVGGLRAVDRSAPADAAFDEARLVAALPDPERARFTEELERCARLTRGSASASDGERGSPAP